MRKIKIFILCLFFVALGTVGAVAGFYIDENSTAVVNWLNNTINVTNEDYKQLVEEYKVTTLQLNLEIASLEEENAQLRFEKEDLTNKVAELEQSEEDNQELIQDYTNQIAVLDEQIIEKDSMIADLQELVNSINQGLINELFVLPDDLKDLSIVAVPCEDGLMLEFSNSTLYMFDFDNGEMKLLQTDENYYKSFTKVVPCGYFYASGSGNSANLVYVNKFTQEKTTLLTSIYEVYYTEYANGCFVRGTGGMYYVDYATGNIIKSTDSYVSSYMFSFYDRGDFIVFEGGGGSSSYSGSVAIINKETMTGGFVDFKLYESSGYWDVFFLKGSFYLVIGRFKSTGSSFGLYKVNDDYSIELVYEFVDQSYGIVNGLYVNDDIATFSHKSTFYIFDGENVSIGFDSSNSISCDNTFTTFLETDSFEYMASGSAWLKYDKANKTFTKLGITYSYKSHLYFSDGRMIIFAKNGSNQHSYTFNVETESLDSFATYISDYYFEHDGYFYYLSDSSQYPTFYRMDLSTLTKTTIKYSGSNYVTFISLEVVGDVLIFYWESAYMLYCPTRDIVLSNTIFSYDSALTNFKDRTVYKKLLDLDNGILYEKFVYNEDFTDFTKSLVIVK